jgi:hypothetical protein
VSGSQDLGGVTITLAERNAWQRRACAVLAKILERAAAEGLPPIAWTVQRAGATLVGQCLATEPGERRAEFHAWRIALARWAGYRADVKRQHVTSAGRTRLVDQWERYERAQVTITADIYDDGPELEPDPAEAHGFGRNQPGPCGGGGGAAKIRLMGTPEECSEVASRLPAIVEPDFYH